MNNTTKVVGLEGSPRPRGNSKLLLGAFLDAASEAGAAVRKTRAADLFITPCRGCLQCNAAGRCQAPDDDWRKLAADILAADVLVFASPIYFRQFPAPLKLILDRFRCFLHVDVTGSGLVHQPHHPWSKDIVLLLSQGSPDPEEARPLREQADFLAHCLGPGNRTHVRLGTRLVAEGQVVMEGEQLRRLYTRLGFPDAWVEADLRDNRNLLDEVRELGRSLGRPRGNGKQALQAL
ncbi:MAG: flavodoxin family protein [Acidobacteria bacterium]|nr:flavodoxin family protein [Acidobacteriota bacterium]